MFDLPMINPENVSKDFIDVFGGYNHNQRIGDNEFYDMKNMTSAFYPSIGSRNKRSFVWTTGSQNDYIVGMLFRNGYLYLAMITIESGTPIPSSLKLGKIVNGVISWQKTFSGITPQLGQHKLIMMGAYMIIIPEGVYVNLSDMSDYGTINAEVSTQAQSTAINLCDKDGNAPKIDYVDDNEPKSPTDGYMWLDTSGDAPVLKKYYGSNAMWVADAAQYIKIEGNDIAKDFNEGDAVNVSGISVPALTDLNNITILKNKPDDDTLILNARLEEIEGLYDVFEVTGKTREVGSVELRFSGEMNTVYANKYVGDTFIFGAKRYTCLSNTAPFYGQGWIVSESKQLTNQHNYLKSINEYQAAASSGGYVKIYIQLETGETLNAATNEPLYIEGLEYTEGLKYKSNGSDENGSFILVDGAGHPDIPPNTKFLPMEYGPVHDDKRVIVYLNQYPYPKDGQKALLEPEFLFMQEGSITISRKMPLMDHVIESNNRLWGCRYGQNAAGDFVNEIYASKQGDFKNWECYEGLASDSYAASCGTDGGWTGAISYLSRPVFFKENYIHTVYGGYPEQYQIDSVAARGVQTDSADSLAILNETVYYLSAEGVMTYNGSLPVNISSAFGDIRYHYGIGCAFNNKYYINMMDSQDNDVLMVFDSKRGYWHKEDDETITALCAGDNIYYLGDGSHELRSFYGEPDEYADPVEWYIVTGVNGLSSIDSKYVSRMNLRMSLQQGAHAVLSIQYDNSGVWERLYNVVRKNTNPVTIPVKPRRCDHFRLKIEGKGGITLYSISKTLSQGSDRT